MCCSLVVHFNTCEMCTCAVQWLYTSIHVRCVHVLFHGCTRQYMRGAVQWLYTSIHVRCVHVLFNRSTLQYMCAYAVSRLYMSIMYCSTVVYFNTYEVCTCAVQWFYISIHVTCVHVLFQGCTIQYM